VTRLFVLLALLWHIVLPRAGATHVSDAPSLRSARSTYVGAPVLVRSTTREAARAPSDGAPVALPPSDRAIVACASFVRLPAPAFERVASPDLASIAPVARGPPAG
jgi:hypothetical protein